MVKAPLRKLGKLHLLCTGCASVLKTQQPRASCLSWHMSLTNTWLIRVDVAEASHYGAYSRAKMELFNYLNCHEHVLSPCHFCLFHRFSPPAWGLFATDPREQGALGGDPQPPPPGRARLHSNSPSQRPRREPAVHKHLLLLRLSEALREEPR